MAGGKRCATCHQHGHGFRECENQCIYCRKIHKGGICPDFPDGYPRPDEDARASTLENIQEETARKRQRLEEVNKELAQAAHLERQIGVMREKVEASAGGPLPRLPEGKNAALMAMGKKADGTLSTWRDIHRDWKELPNQAALKAQWNAEALGHQPFAGDSQLEVALRYVRRWPIQWDDNGFPKEIRTE
jgi:hypothetical protein